MRGHARELEECVHRCGTKPASSRGRRMPCRFLDNNVCRDRDLQKSCLLSTHPAVFHMCSPTKHPFAAGISLYRSTELPAVLFFGGEDSVLASKEWSARVQNRLKNYLGRNAR
eukprot:g18128.t1